jgi:hypothetical protein
MGWMEAGDLGLISCRQERAPTEAWTAKEGAHLT